MKANLKRVAAVALVSLVNGVSFAPLATAADDDASGLEELRRAMTEPSEAPKKKRTRAIVFDGDAAQAQPGAAPAASGGGADCAALPPDVRATAVQFPIQFRPGSAVITPGSGNTLTEIGKILALTPDRCVIVEGHTDAEGNPEKNMALSRERANAVVKFIVDKGSVERKRLVPVGKGSTDPLRDLDPRDAKNRRVVFKVVAG
ncbi:MAG: OmpA family protein [Candidatus Accumulibacter sp.]|uniref:OmpA family protein n=1 Tax=Accumulibacter sp. TaxID=2053492 RepID=UPI00287A5491|nr:OmpA family protein [Accumulibacter sp.]MDS4014137.1 OmpA family protein [Accumulibacter sp.]